MGAPKAREKEKAQTRAEMPAAVMPRPARISICTAISASDPQLAQNWQKPRMMRIGQARPIGISLKKILIQMGKTACYHVKLYAAFSNLAFQPISCRTSTRYSHFKNFVHYGIVVVSHASDGTDFRDVEFAVRCQDVVFDVNLFNAPKDDIHRADGRVSGQAMC